ncbi:MAG: response regulator transcription factor [Gammaproteobacteria bacterium]|nr:response regulator transcription factor [Gammaproteobacteria bacterium]
MDALERAVALLGTQQLTNYPRLWLAKVYLALRHGEIETAGRIQCELMDFVDENASNDVELHSELSILQSVINVYADNSISDEEIHGLELLGEVLLGDNDLMHALRCNLLCAMYAQRGNFSDCMAVGDKAIRHFRVMGSVFGETFIYFHEGYASLQQGRVRDAQALYEVGHDLAMDHFGPGSDLVAIASAFLAETAYETNNLHRASQFLSVALPHIERSDAWLEVYVAAYTTAMKLSRSKFALMSAQEVRERARSTASSRGLGRLRQIVDLQMVEFEQWKLLESGVGLDEVSCIELPAGTVEHPTLRQLRVTVAARGLISKGNASAAIDLLESERAICSQLLLLRPYIAFTILLCVAYRNTDQLDKSMAAFEAALSPSLFEGIKRPFINEGSLLVGFIKEFTERSHSRRGNRLRDRFVAELSMEINSNKLIDDNSDSLSPREREILRHLVQGRSNRETCEEMSISINTVKFHVKNVYEKLGVSDRKEAVNASIRRGVI